MHRALVITGALLCVLTGAAPATRAQPADLCTYSGGVVTATLPGGLNERILVNNSLGDSLYLQAGAIQDPCEGATNMNTSKVNVIGSPNVDRFILATEAPYALNASILYDVDLGGSKKDELVVVTTGGDDVVTFGRQTTAAGVIEAVDIDSDGVKDVDLRGAERGAAWDGGGGNDRFSGDPSGGLSPSRLDLLLDGGNRNDRLVGGNGDDFLIGSTGKDRLSGGRGDDRLAGGPQRDVVNGGAGTDFCFAIAGDRVVSCERRRD